MRVQHQASFSPSEGALGWATCEGSLVSGTVEADTETPPCVQPVFVNSGPVLEESVHATAVEQFKAGSPSGQGDWAVMKIPQESSEGNSVLLFVMGKRRRQGQEGSGEAAMSEERKGSEERTHCVHVFVCVCSGGQVAPPNVNETEKKENKVER